MPKLRSANSVQAETLFVITCQYHARVIRRAQFSRTTPINFVCANIGYKS